MNGSRQNRNFHFLIPALAVMLCLPPVLTASPAALTPSFQTVIQDISSPKELVRLMKTHFEFAGDEELFGVADLWQNPEEFWKLGKGDCEDFAIFAHHALRSHGYEAWIVSFYGPGGYAHTVTVFLEDGHYSVINENRLYRYRTETLEEALSRITPFWTWGGIAKKEGTRGWMTRRLTNPRPASPSAAMDPFLFG